MFRGTGVLGAAGADEAEPGTATGPTAAAEIFAANLLESGLSGHGTSCVRRFVDCLRWCGCGGEGTADLDGGAVPFSGG